MNTTWIIAKGVNDGAYCTFSTCLVQSKIASHHIATHVSTCASIVYRPIQDSHNNEKKRWQDSCCWLLTVICGWKRGVATCVKWLLSTCHGAVLHSRSDGYHGNQTNKIPQDSAYEVKGRRTKEIVAHYMSVECIKKVDMFIATDSFVMYDSRVLQYKSDHLTVYRT